MTQKSRILVVDDEKLISWSLGSMLNKVGYEVETAASGAEATERFRAFHPDLVMLDVWLPDANGLDLLRQFKEEDEDLAVVMMTADAHVDSALNALKGGAEDYVGKPFNMEVVKHIVEQAFEKRRLRREVDYFKKELRKKSDYDRLVGTSGKMIEVFKLIKVCAETDAKTVLITGESGTGKELVARAIHAHSARADMPFIEVNCAAIPETLLENELFGHERGAYTDASKKQKGIFEMAEGGTVFLDEIGDMPFPMQAKVLKAIENKRFRRLGGSEDVEASVRIVAATNQDLPRMVQEQKFRGDLFYRLNVMHIDLPSLRDRKEDIACLAQYFIKRLNDEYGRSVESLSTDAMEALMSYSWPGNVRELRNTIERAMMMESSRCLTAVHLRKEITNNVSVGGGQPIPVQECTTCQEFPVAPRVMVPAAPVFAAPSAYAADLPANPVVMLPEEGISMEEVERQLIIMALDRVAGNQTKAASLLRMSRDTLRYRMKKFGLGDFKEE
jgi:DNA-binding NtrC family response regulator